MNDPFGFRKTRTAITETSPINGDPEGGTWLRVFARGLHSRLITFSRTHDVEIDKIMLDVRFDAATRRDALELTVRDEQAETRTSADTYADIAAETPPDEQVLAAPEPHQTAVIRVLQMLHDQNVKAGLIAQDGTHVQTFACSRVYDALQAAKAGVPTLPDEGNAALVEVHSRLTKYIEGVRVTKPVLYLDGLRRAVDAIVELQQERAS